MTIFFVDHWVHMGNGREQNRPKPIHGEISEEDLLFSESDATGRGHMYTYVRLKDGRIFRRSVNYWDRSPYGWQQRDTWGK